MRAGMKRRASDAPARCLAIFRFFPVALLLLFLPTTPSQAYTLADSRGIGPGHGHGRSLHRRGGRPLGELLQSPPVLGNSGRICTISQISRYLIGSFVPASSAERLRPPEVYLDKSVKAPMFGCSGCPRPLEAPKRSAWASAAISPKLQVRRPDPLRHALRPLLPATGTPAPTRCSPLDQRRGGDLPLLYVGADVASALMPET